MNILIVREMRNRDMIGMARMHCNKLVATGDELASVKD